LREYLPTLAMACDLGDIKDQMALFDRLIVDDGVAKIIDLGHASFDLFFSIMEEIGFLRETRRRSLEPTIMFVADAHAVAVRAYAHLQHRFRNALVIPVFNDVTLQAQRVRDQYPIARAAAVPLRIPALSPRLRTQLDEARYSFVNMHDFVDIRDKPPMAIPAGPAYELRAWTRRTFLKFRELELRLLLEQLRTALPGVEF
jgi:hypothetical protein